MPDASNARCQAPFRVRIASQPKPVIPETQKAFLVKLRTSSKEASVTSARVMRPHNIVKSSDIENLASSNKCFDDTVGAVLPTKLKVVIRSENEWFSNKESGKVSKEVHRTVSTEKSQYKTRQVLGSCSENPVDKLGGVTPPEIPDKTFLGRVTPATNKYEEKVRDDVIVPNCPVDFKPVEVLTMRHSRPQDDGQRDASGGQGKFILSDGNMDMTNNSGMQTEPPKNLNHGPTFREVLQTEYLANDQWVDKVLPFAHLYDLPTLKRRLNVCRIRDDLSFDLPSQGDDSVHDSEGDTGLEKNGISRQISNCDLDGGQEVTDDLASTGPTEWNPPPSYRKRLFNRLQYLAHMTIMCVSSLGKREDCFRSSKDEEELGSTSDVRKLQDFLERIIKDLPPSSFGTGIAPQISWAVPSEEKPLNYKDVAKDREALVAMVAKVEEQAQLGNVLHYTRPDSTLVDTLIDRDLKRPPSTFMLRVKESSQKINHENSDNGEESETDYGGYNCEDNSQAPFEDRDGRNLYQRNETQSEMGDTRTKMLSLIDDSCLARILSDKRLKGKEENNVMPMLWYDLTSSKEVRPPSALYSTTGADKKCSSECLPWWKYYSEEEKKSRQLVGNLDRNEIKCDILFQSREEIMEEKSELRRACPLTYYQSSRRKRRKYLVSLEDEDWNICRHEDLLSDYRRNRRRLEAQQMEEGTKDIYSSNPDGGARDSPRNKSSPRVRPMMRDGDLSREIGRDDDPFLEMELSDISSASCYTSDEDMDKDDFVNANSILAKRLKHKKFNDMTNVTNNATAFLHIVDDSLTAEAAEGDNSWMYAAEGIDHATILRRASELRHLVDLRRSKPKFSETKQKELSLKEEKTIARVRLRHAFLRQRQNCHPLTLSREELYYNGFMNSYLGNEKLMTRGQLEPRLTRKETLRSGGGELLSGVNVNNMTPEEQARYQQVMNEREMRRQEMQRQHQQHLDQQRKVVEEKLANTKITDGAPPPFFRRGRGRPRKFVPGTTSTCRILISDIKDPNIKLWCSIAGRHDNLPCLPPSFMEGQNEKRDDDIAKIAAITAGKQDIRPNARVSPINPNTSTIAHREFMAATSYLASRGMLPPGELMSPLNISHAMDVENQYNTANSGSQDENSMYKGVEGGRNVNIGGGMINPLESPLLLSPTSSQMSSPSKDNRRGDWPNHEQGPRIRGPYRTKRRIQEMAELAAQQRARGGNMSAQEMQSQIQHVRQMQQAQHMQQLQHTLPNHNNYNAVHNPTTQNMLQNNMRNVNMIPNGAQRVDMQSNDKNVQNSSKMSHMMNTGITHPQQPAASLDLNSQIPNDRRQMQSNPSTSQTAANGAPNVSTQNNVSRTLQTHVGSRAGNHSQAHNTRYDAGHQSERARKGSSGESQDNKFFPEAHLSQNTSSGKSDFITSKGHISLNHMRGSSNTEPTSAYSNELGGENKTSKKPVRDDICPPNNRKHDIMPQKVTITLAKAPNSEKTDFGAGRNMPPHANPLHPPLSGGENKAGGMPEVSSDGRTRRVAAGARMANIMADIHRRSNARIMPEQKRGNVVQNTHRNHKHEKLHGQEGKTHVEKTEEITQNIPNFKIQKITLASAATHHTDDSSHQK